MDIIHKFNSHQVSEETSILILGTFHPDIIESGEFFYTRPRNFLWTILPACFGHKNLKESNFKEKQSFMREKSIDFHDIIKSIQNPNSKENIISDKVIEKYILKFSETIDLFKSLKRLEAVYFTRKTLDGIPKIANRIAEIRNHCVKNNIRFSLLETPSRYSNDKKIKSWKECIVEKTKCY
ncbi:MAG: hypothetical protein WBA61_16460 [Aequorivita sp.]